jgi:phenol 2-monooxygenase
VDDESYNSGHGHAYEKYEIDVDEGAMVVVRPDQCESISCLLHYSVVDVHLDVSLVTSLDDHEGLTRFYEGFVLPPILKFVNGRSV